MKDFQYEKQTWCGKLHFGVTHFVKLFISLRVPNPFPFCVYLILLIPVFNIEPYGLLLGTGYM